MSDNILSKVEDNNNRLTLQVNSALTQALGHTSISDETNNSAFMVDSLYKQQAANEATKEFNKQFGSQFSNSPRNGYQRNSGGYNGNNNGYRSQQAAATPMPLTVADHCTTCGQHRSVCAPVKDTAGTDCCPLREVEVSGRININIVTLDKLKLIELPTDQCNQIIEAASQLGCMKGISAQDKETFKDMIQQRRDALSKSLSGPRSN
jgi:hypothetical protein